MVQAGLSRRSLGAQGPVCLRLSCDGATQDPGTALHRASGATSCPHSSLAARSWCHDPSALCHPQWVLAFEIFIPLVLFFILLGLRQKKPTIPVKEGECWWVVCGATPGSGELLQPPGDSLGGAEGLQQLVGTQKGLLGDMVLGRGCSWWLVGHTQRGREPGSVPTWGDPLGVAVPTSLWLSSAGTVGEMELDGAGTATVTLSV